MANLLTPTLVAALLSCIALPAVAASVTSTWLGGSGTWTDPARWDSGVPQNTATDSFDAIIDGGNPVASVVTLDSQATIGSLHVDSGDALAVTAAGQLKIDGGRIENAGSITLNGSVDATARPVMSGDPNDPYFQPTTILSGGGQIVLEGGALSGYYLTNEDNRISGWGAVGYGIVSYGVIEANVSGRSLLLGSGVSSYGVLRATHGGLLEISGGCCAPFVAGTVEAVDGGQVTMKEYTDSFNASFSASGGGTMNLGGGHANARFVTDAVSMITLAFTSSVANSEFDGNARVYGDVGGQIINRGTLLLETEDSSQAPLDIVNYGHISTDFIYSGGRSITFEGGGSVTVSTLDPDFVSIFGSVRNIDNRFGGAGLVSGLVQNGGSIEATTGVLRITSPGVTHSGIFGATAGGTLEMAAPVSGSGSWLADAGMIHVTGDVETTGDISVVHSGSLGIDATMSGGTLLVDETGSLDVQGILRVAGNLDFDGSNGGRWLFHPGASLEASRGGGAAVGDWGGWQLFEASGRDLGLVPAGFTNDNFYLPSLVIGPDGRLALRDLRDNGNRDGDGHEAIYVDTLVFSDSLGLLNLNGIDLYYNHLVGSPAQIINVAVPEPGAAWLVGISIVALLRAARRSRRGSR